MGARLSIATARASYSMEMVERASAYLSVDGDAITDRLHPTPIVRASHAELLAQGRAAIDPRGLPIDAEYNDQPLYWMEGRGVSGSAILVPVQAVGLFCNLDEPALFLSPVPRAWLRATHSMKPRSARSLKYWNATPKPRYRGGAASASSCSRTASTRWRYFSRITPGAASMSGSGT